MQRHRAHPGTMPSSPAEAWAAPQDARAAERDAVFAVVDAAFAQRRKTMRSALAGWAGSPVEAERRLRAAGIDPQIRGEKLDVAAFAALAETLAATGSLPAPTAQENR